MDSEINDTATGEAATAQEMNTEVAVSDPPIVLVGPKTKVTPRTNTAPRGKIFEDGVRGTVFWEVAESSDEDDVDAALPKAADKWGNPFRIEWIKWFFQASIGI